jgi:hypothetical protein
MPYWARRNIMFDKKAFDKDFNSRIAQLGKAEKGVREQVNVLSRSILTAIHVTENIGYVNQFLGALTPVNRKAAVVFFKHFAGFHYDDATKLFSKKSKKRYEQAHQDSVTFLADPLNNMFSWADRHIEVEQKPFDPETFTKGFKSLFDKRLQEARNHGMAQTELFTLLFKKEEGKPGIDVNALISVLEAMDIVEVQHTTEQEALI